MARIFIIGNGTVGCTNCKKRWLSLKLIKKGSTPVQCRFCHVKFRKAK